MSANWQILDCQSSAHAAVVGALNVAVAEKNIGAQELGSLVAAAAAAAVEPLQLRLLQPQPLADCDDHKRWERNVALCSPLRRLLGVAEVFGASVFAVFVGTETEIETETSSVEIAIV